MRYIIEKHLVLLFSLFFLFLPCLSAAEIYRWVDNKGRIQFSDSPNPDYQTQALASSYKSVSASFDLQVLQKKAKQLKQDRLEREKAVKKAFNTKRQKRLRNERAIAKRNKKKQACDNAKKKENLAFRQRTKSRRLMAMRRALERYENKRLIRIKKCQ